MDDPLARALADVTGDSGSRKTKTKRQPRDSSVKICKRPATAADNVKRRPAAALEVAKRAKASDTIPSVGTILAERCISGRCHRNGEFFPLKVFVNQLASRVCDEDPNTREKDRLYDRLLCPVAKGFTGTKLAIAWGYGL